MRIVKPNSEIIKELEGNGISKEMISFFKTSKWLILGETDEKIIGVAGIGGMFNLAGVEVIKNIQGKGVGALLQRKLIQESKKFGYAFITVMIDPKNELSVRLHDAFEFKRCFRINYSSEIIQDIGILTFNWKGKVIERFLKMLNNKIGMVFLALLLSSLKSLFSQVINLNENIPNPNIKWIIKNFEKI